MKRRMLLRGFRYWMLKAKYALISPHNALKKSDVESGHTFEINGENKKLQGTIALISADNPASSACGGFKEGSTAYHFCRQCLATSDESKKIVG